MKKLFKEVWKSFSKSKVVLAGLIILIFLTSGIITLVFDAVRSYKTQFNMYKKSSNIQDLTLNSNINLYGEKPEKMYDVENISQNYRNNFNLLDNQWKYEEINTYIDSIDLATNSEYYQLKIFFSNFNFDNLYVSTKDISYLLNTNYNINPDSLKDNQNETYTMELEKNANNEVQLFYLNNDNSYIKIEDYEVSTLNGGIYDTYDSTQRQWSASLNPKNLWKSALFGSSFKPILFNKIDQKFYLKEAVENATGSDIKQQYETFANLFIELSESQVGNLLGFYKEGIGIIGTWKIDTSKNNHWILNGDINAYNGQTANNLLKNNSEFNIQINPDSNLGKNNNIKVNGKINFESITFPKKWLVKSKYTYIYTRNKIVLNGFNPETNEINRNLWTGYYYQYLDNIKNNNEELFQNFTSFYYWTKEVIVSKVDLDGNTIFVTNQNGEEIVNEDNLNNGYNGKEIISSNFQIAMNEKDLTLELENNNGTKETIQEIEHLPIINNLIAKDLNTNKSQENESLIEKNSYFFKSNQIYQNIKNISDKLGLRRTLTVNSNSNKKTNVFQFINLGNEKYEIEWNDINIKQEVGKLIDTDLNNDIFSMESNLNLNVDKIPLEYVGQIIEQVLKGLSLNRNYINPMISFGSFSYLKNNETITLSSEKIVWLTENGNKDLSNVFGIASIKNTDNNSSQLYFVLKMNLLDENSEWTVINESKNGLNFEQLNDFINQNNLNFAPFDLYGNDLKVVGDNGWLRQDDTYKDKYSVPFQYLLPNSEIINDFNKVNNDPNSNLYGVEIFRDNLRYSLTMNIKPLISASNWNILTEAVNIAFSNYGFADSLTPPATITFKTLIDVLIGTLREATKLTNENFFSSFFSNLLDGIKRQINPSGNTPIEQQQQNLEKEINTLFNILKVTQGNSNFEETILNFVNNLMNSNYTKISEIISNPSLFIDGLKIVFSSINFDNFINELWDEYSKFEINRILGTGDLLPLLYKNIYSTETLLNGIKQIVNSTVLKDFSISLGELNLPISNILNLLKMEEPEKGYENLNNSKKDVTYPISDKNNIELTSSTIPLKNIMQNFSISLIPGFPGINIGDFIPEETSTEFVYDPTLKLPLELDLDLLWYLNNFAFTTKKEQTKNIDYLSCDVELFGVNLGEFLSSATIAFTEVKDDYNQITMTDNRGKLAIVNEAFLQQNNKEVYKSNTLSNDINDLSKINEKYKINVNNIEYLIIGDDFTVDYMYPIINAENITVNTKTQALVYVNQYGYDRAKRSNENSQTDQYFLISAKPNQNLLQLQTWLNIIIYEATTGRILTEEEANEYGIKFAYLANEYSNINPERSMRLTIIEEMISNLEAAQKIIGIMLIIIVAISIMFVVRRYIASKSKVLGILKAQGYSSFKIALSICLFPLFVSIIGATLGYIAGLVFQFAFFELFTIFWTVPISTITFNWLTFLITLLAPILLLSLLTIGTTYWFLHKNKPMAMMNGSMEVNNNIFAKKIKKIASKISLKNRFSLSLALGSIGKLIALFISATFTAGVSLFFIVSFNTFNKTIDKTFSNKNYNYSILFNTPTIEGGELTTFYISNSAANDINNINFDNVLYVPVGDVQEGYTYLANYFEPGFNSIINQMININDVNYPANGNLSNDDTTTPHIFTKSSVDLTVATEGLSLNVWNNLYNAIPESQRASIIEKSNISSEWLKWTQEGKEITYNGKTYITKFENYNVFDEDQGYSLEYLTLFDPEQQTNLKVRVSDPNNLIQEIEIDFRLPYFYYELDNQDLSKSKFIFKETNLNNYKNNYYDDNNLILDGSNHSKIMRFIYRRFLVEGYTKMFNFYLSQNLENNLSEELRTEMPVFSLDYFISPSALFLMNNENNDELNNDETFTFIDSVISSNIKQNIIGYSENSKLIKVLDNSGNDLIKKANEFYEEKNENNINKIYPIIINKVVEKKYKLKVNDVLNVEVLNSYDRYENKLKEKLNEKTQSKIFKFQIIGIYDSYINEEWITSKKVANDVLGMSEKSYNGILSNSESPISLTNILTLYSTNGYWSADSKIFESNNLSSLSDSQKRIIINTYSQIFYLEKDGENVSLMSKNIKRIFPGMTNDEVNNKIKQFLGINENDSLKIEYSQSDSSQNLSNAIKANNYIREFIKIYSDNALSNFFVNATSNGVEKDYINNLAFTLNDGMTIVIVTSFAISLVILVMITSIIINENERNIAIFSILGYKNKTKIRMFFIIYIPVVLLSVLTAALVVWLILPAFLSYLLSTTSIYLIINISFLHILISTGIISFIFAITCLIAWYVQGRVKPVMLLKEV